MTPSSKTQTSWLDSSYNVYLTPLVTHNSHLWHVQNWQRKVDSKMKTVRTSLFETLEHSTARSPTHPNLSSGRHRFSTYIFTLCKWNSHCASEISMQCHNWDVGVACGFRKDCTEIQRGGKGERRVFQVRYDRYKWVFCALIFSEIFIGANKCIPLKGRLVCISHRTTSSTPPVWRLNYSYLSPRRTTATFYN